MKLKGLQRLYAKICFLKHLLEHKYANKKGNSDFKVGKEDAQGRKQAGPVLQHKHP